MTNRDTATLDDVARRAGVHPGTVSRVLTRPGRVNEKTAARVQAAVAAVGYRPNLAARQLAGGKTSRVAVIVPDITNPYFAEIVQEVQLGARDRSEAVLVADSRQAAPDELSAVESLSPNVDGLIVCSPVAALAMVRDAADGKPVVYVNRRGRNVAAVHVDQGAVVTVAVAHLRSLGHDRIAIVRGPSAFWSAEQRSRLAGKLGVAQLGPVSPTYEGGLALIDEIVDGAFTAVATFNDVTAFGVLGGATARGIRVPDELSVIGSDNIPFSAMTNPPLTTVDGRARQVGRAALDLLGSLLAGDSPRVVVVDPAMVTRSSTGVAS
ncbi:MAG: LacI family DNA-binding transcriptional regulator [Microthrixaceae bacterium]